MSGHKHKNAATKSFRQESNIKYVEMAMNGELNGAIYAKVLNHLGNGQVRVYFENSKKQATEVTAVIRKVLQRKGQVPIYTNDVVVITLICGNRFELMGVLNSKQLSELKKRNDIPSYFINDVNSDNFNKKDSTEAFEFDYNDAEEVDIDGI
jgi:translation initiation factor IF-1